MRRECRPKWNREARGGNAWDASGNIGTGEQRADRVCSVICQVHTKICVAAKTGPISDATVVVP